MKRITLFILLLLLSLDTVKSQTYSSIISDDEIYDFVNSIIVSNKNRFDWSLLKKINLHPEIEDGWDSLNFVRPNIGNDTMRFIIKSGVDEIEYFFMYLGIDTLFTEEDRLYMMKQYQSLKDTQWQTAFKKSRLTNKKQKNPNRYYFAIPVFSSDKSKAIFNYTYYCGDLCAFGGYFIFSKDKHGIWQFIDAYGVWQS